MLQLILGGRVAVTGVGGDGSAYNARGSRVDWLAVPGAADAGGYRTLIADFSGPEFVFFVWGTVLFVGLDMSSLECCDKNLFFVREKEGSCQPTLHELQKRARARAR